MNFEIIEYHEKYYTIKGFMDAYIREFIKLNPTTTILKTTNRALEISFHKNRYCLLSDLNDEDFVNRSQVVPFTPVKASIAEQRKSPGRTQATLEENFERNKPTNEDDDVSSHEDDTES